LRLWLRRERECRRAENDGRENGFDIHLDTTKTFLETR
jgi:hypothetical protein